MRYVHQSFWVMMCLVASAFVCLGQQEPPIRFQKAPVPPATNSISPEELGRLAAEQDRMLEARYPWLVTERTNQVLMQAINYVVADMAGHAPEKLPPGLTQADISNAYFRMFAAPQSNLMPHAVTQVTSVQVSNFVSEIDRTVNAPIEFYGKVVDHEGKPIEEVSVEFACVIYPEEHFVTNVTSSKSGLFSVKIVKGSKLDVRLSKAGYAFDKSSNETTSFIYTQLPAYGTERFHPDAQSPVLFHMKRE